MLDNLKKLCEINAPSGNEESVREFIIDRLPSDAECFIDALGNLIVNKKGKRKPKNKVMIDVHMDEVGLIITGITGEGFLRFTTIGGIEPNVLISRRVVIENSIIGVICSKPVHNMTEDEKKARIDIDSLYIDIGAANIEEANKLIFPGDVASFDVPFNDLGDDLILSKALDDRIGCAVALDILNSFDEYDYSVSFSVQEEVGIRGAKTSTYAISPDFAIALEVTTAADVDGVSDDRSICNLSEGVAVSFMDGATLYDKNMFLEALNIAKENNINCQPKRGVSGGNNAGSIHLSKSGVKTIALSVPCRYIHSPSCVASKSDVLSMRALAEELLKTYCEK